LRRRNYGNGFLSVMVLRAIDETLQVLRQSSDATVISSIGQLDIIAAHIMP
jgi:hypothetical protein